MSGENLDKLTDRELRQMLIDNGFENVPVTGTTRKFLQNKLEKHLRSQEVSKTPSEKINIKKAKVAEAKSSRKSRRSDLITSEPVDHRREINVISQALGQISSNLPQQQYTLNGTSKKPISKTFEKIAIGTILMGVLLAVGAYLFLKSSHLPPIKDRKVAYNLCEEDARTSFSCIRGEQVQNAIEICQIIYQTLSTATVADDFECDEDNMFPRISFEDFHSLHPGISFAELKDAQYMIENNPQWKLVVGLSSQMSGFTFTFIDTKLKVKCIFKRKFRRFWITIGSLSTFTLICIVIYGLVQIIRKSISKKQKMVDHMTTEIYKALEATPKHHHGPKTFDFIVNDLRDKIISRNSSNLKLWNEAIANIERTDCRVSFGQTQRNGEIFKTIRLNTF